MDNETDAMWATTYVIRDQNGHVWARGTRSIVVAALQRRYPDEDWTGSDPVLGMRLTAHGMRGEVININAD